MVIYLFWSGVVEITVNFVLFTQVTLTVQATISQPIPVPLRWVPPISVSIPPQPIPFPSAQQVPQQLEIPQSQRQAISLQEPRFTQVQKNFSILL